MVLTKPYDFFSIKFIQHFCACLFILANPLLAENTIQFDKMTIEDGLSQGSIQCIFQDSRGLMWFGTQDGLNKFDGYEYTIFQNSQDDSLSISGNTINDIVEDANGYLWIALANSGLNRYDRFQNTFRRFFVGKDTINSISDNQIYELHIEKTDSSEVLIINTYNNGLNKMDLLTGKIDHLDNEGMPLYIYTMCTYKPGVLLLSAWSGYYTYDIINNQFSRFTAEPWSNDILKTNTIVCLYKDQRGRIWMGSETSGLFRYDPDTEKMTHWATEYKGKRHLSNNNIIAISSDAFGNIWIGTSGGGAVKIEAITENIEIYRFLPDLAHSLSHDMVVTFFLDHSGLFWIGTENGLNKLNPSLHKFNQDDNFGQNHNWLENENIWAFLKTSDDFLWLGTERGLYIINALGKIVNHWKAGKTGKVVADNNVMALEEGVDGDIWIATYEGLNRWRSKKNKMIKYVTELPDSSGLPSNQIMCLKQDPVDNSIIWIGTMYGMTRFDKSIDRFIDFPDSIKKSPNPLENYVSCFTFDKHGHLYIGTENNGVWKYDRERNRFKVYTRELHKLSSNRINSILIDSAEKFWVCTYGGGLNLWIEDIQQFKSYTLKDGLPNSVVYGAVEDDNHYLWLSTNRGLSHMNIETETFFNYDKYYGMQNNEYNQGAYYKDSSGKLYFGGVNGYNSFFPDELSLNTFIPPVIITDFQLFNKNVTICKGQPIEKHISECDEINLKPGENIFTLVYAALDYHIPLRNRYAYRLHGYEEDWIQAGTRRVVTYSNLKPGRYCFQVKASNDDGIWNTEGVSLFINIKPELQQRLWFKILACILLTFFAGVAYRYRTRLLRIRARTLEQEIAERTTDLRENNERLQEEIKVRKEAEKAVIISRERYLNFFEQSSEGIWRMEIEPPFPIDLNINDQVHKICYDSAVAECNKAFAEMYGMEISEIIGKSLADLHGGSDNPENVIEYIDFIKAGYRTDDAETHEIDHAGNDIFILNNSFGVIHKGKLIRIWGTQRDITDRKNIETQIKASLKEKDVLLKEIHHRVKNNMQIISSLLQLQARRIDDPCVINILHESQARVRSMALVHEMLYGSHSLSEIDFASYTKRLVNSLYSVYGNPSKPIAFNFSMKEILLPVDLAIPCGLVVNELLTNTLKHAFPDNWEGEKIVSISIFENSSEEIIIELGDSGKGMPEDFDVEHSHSLGLFLVHILIEEQLRGEFNFQNKLAGGATFSLKIPRKIIYHNASI
ncbi:PAS domain-containing protein [bacterium]|nr:PAS domain-containing protein [bacterium]